MKYISEPSREIPVIAEAEVLVAGAGPAGFAAAVRAGRMGAKTLLVDMQGAVGGVATTGLMSHFTGWSSSRILKELYSKEAEIADDFDGFRFKNKPTHLINPEKCKPAMYNMLKEAGVEVLLYTFISDAIKDENGDVRGVIVENKDGRGAILADVTIDATGDGDVAARAGVPYTLGREGDGLMQPCTLMFKLGGVDYSRAVFPGSFETKVTTEKGELQALAKEKLPHPAGHVLLYPSTLPGIVTVNMTNSIGIDGTKAADLTAATIECTMQMDKIVDFLREYAQGYESCFAVSSASYIGVRETRHFAGMYTLNEYDILEARLFNDWVVKQAYFNFDVHNLTGGGLDKTGVQHKFKQNQPYSIPLGAIIPEGCGRLLLSGRNISGTHLAHSNFRVMPIAMATGEAAGACAALAVKNHTAVAYVNAADIQSAVES